MTLIGLIGKSGSGKSTTASLLTRNYGFVEIAFADPLKEACQKLFLLSDQQINGTLEDKETPDPRWFNCTPRRMFQFIGTDLLRNQLDAIMPGLGKDVFVHHFKIWYQKQLEINKDIRVIISDVRFPNEADVIQELGGYLIKIERPDFNPFGYQNSQHESEQNVQIINNYDSLVINDGTQEKFLAKMDLLLNELIKI